jgi:hypothetical protein
MYLTVIEQQETKEWFAECPHCHDLLLQGYKEAISDMTNSVLKDSRATKK